MLTGMRKAVFTIVYTFISIESFKKTHAATIRRITVAYPSTSSRSNPIFRISKKRWIFFRTTGSSTGTYIIF
ncbi:MAG: hypothetical protein ACFFAH_01320 [Promethearchaeota archaeon]